MKEFEKQFGKACMFPDVNCRDMDCRECKKIQQSIWKAALKCALNSNGRGKLYDCDGNEYDIVLVSTIKKELENE